MAKPLFDADALITMFENATAESGDKVRKAVGDATLAALQARELSLKNIRGALQQVADAAAQGAAKNVVAGADVPGLLDKAVAGMDQALLRAVDANRAALGMLVSQGADLRDGALKKALADMEKFEDTLMAALKKAAGGAGVTLQGPFDAVLEKLQAGGTLSGAGAAKTVEGLMDQMQQSMRASRASSLRAVQAMADSYTSMVSGVLIGMSEALQGKTAAPPKAGAARKAAK
jgi:hypothetical protein